MAVLFGHLRAGFFGSYRKSGSHNPVAAGLMCLSSVSHDAVIIFFVLSGYLIGASVLKGAVTQRWTWNSYLIKRATRLYVVLLPSITLTAILRPPWHSTVWCVGEYLWRKQTWIQLGLYQPGH